MAEAVDGCVKPAKGPILQTATETIQTNLV